MKGKTIVEDSKALGHSAETAVVTHLAAHTPSIHARRSYWISPKNKELDLVVEVGEKIIPFEVKYQSQVISQRDIQGLSDFCRNRFPGFILTKSSQDIGPIKDSPTSLMRIPVPLFCYWIGLAEIEQKDIF